MQGRLCTVSPSLSSLSSIKAQPYWSSKSFVFIVAIVTSVVTNIKSQNLTLVDYRLWFMCWQPWPSSSQPHLPQLRCFCACWQHWVKFLIVVVATFMQYGHNSVRHQKRGRNDVHVFWLHYHVHWHIMLKLSK